MSGPRLLVRGGRLIDPSQGIDGPRSLLIEDGRVSHLWEEGEPAPPAQDTDEILEAEGMWLLPGFIDLHTHLREPGEEGKETLASGGQAAAAGGFTSLVAMANTRPVLDRVEGLEWLVARAAATSPVRIHPVAAVTLGQRGEALADLGALRNAGAIAFSDDGHPVMNAGLMRRALEYARPLGVPILVHEEDLTLSGGAIHEGRVATRLGLPGIPAQAEEVMVLRDIALCELTGGPLHICHLSTAGSVQAVRTAKARGLPVTAEVTPHHLTLTEEAVGAYDANAKMSPPLRTQADIEALWEGLTDGTLDAIATDHAPHGAAHKEVEFQRAANGVVGLETAFSLGLRLVRRGVLPLERLVELLTVGPARALGLPGGSLAVGELADFTLVDGSAEWRVNPARMASKSRNSPFAGWLLPGVVRVTVVGGRIVYSQNRV